MPQGSGPIDLTAKYSAGQNHQALLTSSHLVHSGALMTVEKVPGMHPTHISSPPTYLNPGGQVSPVKEVSHESINAFSFGSWNSLEFFGILWNSLEFFGILWNSLEFF